MLPAFRQEMPSLVGKMPRHLVTVTRLTPDAIGGGESLQMHRGRSRGNAHHRRNSLGRRPEGVLQKGQDLQFNFGSVGMMDDPFFDAMQDFFELAFGEVQASASFGSMRESGTCQFE